MQNGGFSTFGVFYRILGGLFTDFFLGGGCHILYRKNLLKPLFCILPSVVQVYDMYDELLKANFMEIECHANIL